MSTIIYQKICSNIYMWSLYTENCSLPQSKCSNLQEINKNLIQTVLKIQIGNSDELKKEVKNYYKEILKVIPNLDTNFDSLYRFILEKFDNFNSDILTEKNKGANIILESIQSNYVFKSSVPRIFLSDLQLQNEKLKFLTKIIETQDYSEKYILNQFISTFQDFICGFSKITEYNIKDIVLKVVKSYSKFLEGHQNALCKTLEDFFQVMIFDHTFKKVTLKASMISKNPNLQDERLIDFYENIYFEELFVLKQILIIGEKKLLITISLENSQKLECLLFDNYEITRLQKPFKHNDVCIAQGSVIDSLIIFINSQRMCYEAQIAKEKLKLIAKVGNYTDKIERVISACYIKSDKIVIYMYPPGALDQFSLIGNSKKDFSNIVPKIYNELFISECGKFIMLVCDNECYLFDWRMKVVGKEKIVPLYFCMENNEITILYNDEDYYFFKILRVDKDARESNRAFELSADMLTNSCRQTIELGKAAIGGMLTNENEEAKEKITERK
ncbi:hypothetical protein SteCoe_17799 [Stentor coeruleus]|uniref:Uncharacterized protein n=1 Tax=Stentor coeruleus TaxID=5963 RepID=A0A1R2BY07_9CILI|nr:hypothetical protein SteCoe_17799 [Stentor coeruleus]